MRKINSYFESEEPVIQESPSPGKRGKNKKNGDGKKGGKKTLIILLSVLGAVVVLAGLYIALDFAGVTPAAKRRAYLQSVNDSQVFLSGVSVDGVDISGLTIAEAQAKIEAEHDADPFDEIQYSLSFSAQAETIKTEAEQARLAEEQELAKKAEEASQEAETAESVAKNEAESEEATQEELATMEPEEEVPAEEPQPVVELAKDANGAYLLTKKDFTLNFNTDDVLAEALSLAKDIEKYDEAVAFIEDVAANGRQFKTDYTLDISACKEMLQAIADDAKVSPVDARFVYYTSSNAQENEADNTDAEKDFASFLKSRFEYIDEKSGFDVDVETLYSSIEGMASQKQFGSIELPIKETEAEVTVEKLENQIAFRSTYYTSFAGSSHGYPERVYNITKASGLINGVIVQPGETFSMNDTLGQRTSKNGWKMAGALSGGETVKQAGGGVCQVATTLYKAVVMADLEIVYRQAHTQQLSYVDGGTDATINSVGNMIDFKWRNNTDAPIIIVSYVDGYKIVVYIIGAPFTGDYDNIKITSKKIASIEPEGDIVYQEDPTLAPGETVVKVKRRVGSKWESFKHYYKGDVEVKSEPLASSSYKSYNGVTLIGPGTVVAPPPAA